MNPRWCNFLPDIPHHSEATQAAQFDALKHGSFATISTDSGIITCSGTDAIAFIQSQLTANITQSLTHTATLAGYCSPKGRLLATFLVWKDENCISLICSADVRVSIQKRLSMFLLRAKAKLADGTNDRALLRVGGHSVELVLKQYFSTLPITPLSITHSQTAGTLVCLPNASTAARARAHYLWSIPVEVVKHVWENLLNVPNLEIIAPELVHWLDVQSGVPKIVAVTQEQFVPQMINLELIGGVSFRKGCYPGQEIVARSQYRGTIKRRLFLAHLDDGQPKPGQELFESSDKQQPCGHVLNVSHSPEGGWDCLVEVKLMARAADDVHLGQVDGTRLKFLALPYAL
ncbi:YgfZ/GcvT domain-containing protein [Candidatus Pandoraea novymonadis]|uniref:tRNA-modifying protein YgfZ n=1 Tax=Candidatus Pandoraea novymonadis TaxID=1808959 RepID=A0ABX5FEI8_9BURK|nr:folate-binding protein YgfZ [Candidatus Pandoraea novymonadis]PSB92124.1 tRNA-modifying protein YgfZ [Candidatus Pandoraea novymonadis]